MLSKVMLLAICPCAPGPWHTAGKAPGLDGVLGSCSREGAALATEMRIRLGAIRRPSGDGKGTADTARGSGTGSSGQGLELFPVEPRRNVGPGHGLAKSLHLPPMGLSLARQAHGPRDPDHCGQP